MDANQTLQGQGATFTLNGLTIPAGTRPTLTGTVTLADNTTVRAVNFTPSGIPAMAASAVSFAQPVTIDQVNVTGGTSALSLTNVTATATGAINVSNAAFTNTSAAEVLISQGTIPVTLAATATISSNAGRSIDIQNRTGGTVTFNGAITDTGQGVFLNANIGIDHQLHRAACRSARRPTRASPRPSGGTVSATQNNTTIVNTITTTTGTALNVANTTIGASGLTFRSISAGTGVSGPAKGIILSSHRRWRVHCHRDRRGKQRRHDSEREQPRRRVHLREQRDVERHGLQQQRDRRRGRQLRLLLWGRPRLAVS